MATTSRSADLTSGPMLQKIILFSVPLAASSILQLLFNAADVVVVGRFAGSTALAAVGSNGALINLLVHLFVGLSLGANVVAARCFGARDEKGVQDTVHTAVALGLVSGVLLAVVVGTNLWLTRNLFAHIREPLAALMQGIHHIQNGDLNAPIAYTKNDEFRPACDAVDEMAARLREKIEDTPSDPKLLQTVWGVGYRLHTV